MSIGPKTTIKRSCADCEVCQRERYTCQGDSGTDVYCAHPNFPVRRIIGDTRWDTPQWCPVPVEPEAVGQAAAEIARLREMLYAIVNRCEGQAREIARAALEQAK